VNRRGCVRLVFSDVFDLCVRCVVWQGKGDVLYSSLKLKGVPVLLELQVGASGITGAAKSQENALSRAALQAMVRLLQ